MPRVHDAIAAWTGSTWGRSGTSSETRMPTAPPIAQSSKRAVAYPDVGPRATTRIIEKVTCPRAPDPIGSRFETASPTKVATNSAKAVRPAALTRTVANATPMMLPATV